MKKLPESIWLIALLIALPIAAEAHHFKGLPHFNYFENYPQVPQDEFLGQKGHYEFSLVLYDFQGIQKEEAEQPDDARFYLIAFNLLKNQVYNGPVTLEILDRGNPVYTEQFDSSQEESIYAMQQSLPGNGTYALRVTLHDANNLMVKIPFKLSSQKMHWGKWLGLSLAVLLAVVAIGSRKARLVQDRKENARRHSNRPTTVRMAKST